LPTMLADLFTGLMVGNVVLMSLQTVQAQFNE